MVGGGGRDSRDEVGKGRGEWARGENAGNIPMADRAEGEVQG